MNIIELSVALAIASAPPAGNPADAEIRALREAAIRDIGIAIQADLEHRGARFLAPQGGLRRLLDEAVVMEAELAGR